MLQQHTRSFSRVVSKTGIHKSVCGCNMGTGGYKHIKGIRRWDGKKPTHYSDKQHPDAGTSADRAGHLPLQTATVLSLQAEQPHNWRRTAALASWYRGRRCPSSQRHKPSSARWHLNPSVQGMLVPCPTVTKGSIFLCDARKMRQINSSSHFTQSVDQLLISWSPKFN